MSLFICPIVVFGDEEICMDYARVCFLYPKRGDRVRGYARDEDDVKTTDEIQRP